MEAYLALTCHYINGNLQLCTSVLGVQYSPQSHTADNLAQVKRGMMEEWAITNKVKCLVTDAAPNMIASIRQLKIQHSICIAHGLNLLVRKSCDQIPALTVDTKLGTLSHTSDQALQPKRSLLKCSNRWDDQPLSMRCQHAGTAHMKCCQGYMMRRNQCGYVWS